MLLSFQQDLNLTESELKRANEENRRLRQIRDQVLDTADVAVMKRKLECDLIPVLRFLIQEYIFPSDPDPFLFGVFYLAGSTYISTVSNHFKERKTCIKMDILQILTIFC
jgi:hypothetical protein